VLLDLVLSVVAGLVLIWLAFAVVLFVTKPEATTMAAAARIVPDTVRLVRRLAADRSVARGVRFRLWFLLGYLLFPIDLIPDVVPVIGFADDALVTSLVLRSVVRRAGAGAVRAHWPGTPDGLDALGRLCRLPELRA
jgi:uncharacterized membrane protein YkvA (DUF1232 family)